MNKKISKSISLILILTMITTNIISIGIPSVVKAEAAQDLFISEYIEGSSYNKALEIYNGTGSSVDLSSYSLELYSNGSATASGTLAFSGEIADGEVLVLANHQAAPEILAKADIINSALINFNGDDAIVLKHDGEIIDVFGKVGDRTWGNGLTADYTLVRKSSIFEGDTDPSDVFDPSIEWDIHDKDNFDFLGRHGGSEPPIEKVANVIASPVAGEVAEGTEVTLTTSTVEATVYYAVYTETITNPEYEVYDESNPVVVSEPLTIEAYATKEGLEDSDVSQFSYTIEQPSAIESIATVRAKDNGLEVTIEGIVTGLIGNNAFIQDETAGIYLYNGSTILSELVVGTKVQVKGTLDDYNNLKQMETNTIVEVVSTENNLPTPISVNLTEIAEEYESELVKVSNLTIKTIPAPTTSGYSIVATDGTNDIDLRVDKYLNPYITLPIEGLEVGDIVTVTAPLGQFRDNYQLMIRSIDDIVKFENTSGNLFISEYIEGSSNNKAIEIYNGTGGAVDLSGYRVELYSNGSISPTNPLDLSGTLAHGDVYVIANSAAVKEILDKSDTTSTVTFFNGDDAIVLKYNEEIIDVFGEVGLDPGSSWGEGGATLDHTLVRKSSITAGDTILDDDFDPTVEWDIHPKDTFKYLGSHNEAQVPDTTAPTITHIPVIEGNVNENLTVTALVTDDRKVESVKLFYKVEGTDNFSEVNMTLLNNEYSYTIPKAALSTAGLKYYIEASDGINITTAPVDITTPFEVVILNVDILAPTVINLTPESGSSTGTELRPIISADYSDESGIAIDSVKLLLDDVEVTTDAIITETNIAYTPVTDLAEGNHLVKLEVSDQGPTPQTAIVEWNFYVGEREFNFYFGQLHSHTGEISDGQGTLDDAYSWARDNGQADFFAVTDHSNWFDNEGTKANENITSVNDSTSNDWKKINATADSFNKAGEFIAIAGFEMTWSGSTGGWGHINTFNTPWFASRSNSSMGMPAYYDHIAADTDSISQFNHPGTTFGDFADFGYYSESVDNVVHLIEVGNGEGPIRGSGYYPSYEYFTRALDKGWHVAPSNNQDNHKANWITANEARTVVLAPELTRSSIFEAIRNLSVYSTEDSNLEIMFKANDNIMGSMLDDPDTLSISIDINDPDTEDKVGKVSIISNGGTVVASKTFDSNQALWEFDLDPQYSYYYVRVDQADMDIAVTAPIWTSAVTPVGMSKVEVSQDPQIVDRPINISATVYNNGSTALNDTKVEFYRDSLEGLKIGESTIATIAGGSSQVATVEWTANEVGKYNIYVKTIINIDGSDKVLSGSTSVTYANAEDVVKVVLDMGHYNAYISGDYAGKDLTLREMFREKKYMLVENHDELTAEDLAGAQLLIITDPQSVDSSTHNLEKSLFTDAEVAAIKVFTDNGGSLIISSKADYKDGVGEYSNGAQLNKILEAVGTNLRVNDDQVVDNTTNGGQPYRLYFNKYVSTKYNLTDNIPAGTLYSFYSGSSVIIKAEGSEETVDWLVKGHDTTETSDADGHGDNVVVEKGNVNVIGAEQLSNGAKVIVAGSIFFSDFETASNDNAYSNKQITENILDWMIQPKVAELKTISEVRIDANNDGTPDLMGQKYTIEGRVTAQSEAVTPKNAFFEVIYVQDETGGITVFGVSATPLPLGTKVRVTGVVDQFDGDTELSVENETYDVLIIGDDNIKLVVPTRLTTGASMLEENEGWLVKIEGIVNRVTTNELYLDDGTGEARVYVNGYIGDGTGNTDTLGKWDESIKVGDTVSAIGLASEDPECHRLRVRNTSEIVKIIEDVEDDDEDEDDNVRPSKPSTQNKKSPIELGILVVDKDVEDLIESKVLDEDDADDILKYFESIDFYQMSEILDIDISTKKINKPVTVNIKYNSNVKDSQKLGLYYFNDNENKWEYIGGKVTKEGFIEVDIDFSGKYVVMEYRITFNDLSTVPWAQREIEVLASRHIVKGIDNNNFAPNSNITRAEFAKLLVVGLDFKLGDNLVSFSDVAPGEWYKEYIDIAASLGIVQGYDNNFDPNGTIIREQMATMIIRALKYVYPDGDYFTGLASFGDNDKVSPWAKDAVEIAAHMGIVNGVGDGAFDPQGNTTRAQSAVIIYRMLNLLNRL